MLPLMRGAPVHVQGEFGGMYIFLVVLGGFLQY